MIVRQEVGQDAYTVGDTPISEPTDNNASPANQLLPFYYNAYFFLQVKLL